MEIRSSSSIVATVIPTVHYPTKAKPHWIISTSQDVDLKKCLQDLFQRWNTMNEKETLTLTDRIFVCVSLFFLIAEGRGKKKDEVCKKNQKFLAMLIWDVLVTQTSHRTVMEEYS